VSVDEKQDAQESSLFELHGVLTGAADTRRTIGAAMAALLRTAHRQAE